MKLLRKDNISITLQFSIAATLTGILAAGYAKLFHIIEIYSGQIFKANPYVFLLLSPLTFLLGWFIVKCLAPEASGSGIPQVMAANCLSEENAHNHIKRLLGIKTLIVKIISSVLCLLGGGAIGREGPTVQISTSIFYLTSRIFKKRYFCLSHHSMITAGGAAGIAAAFNTPLGGIVYAIEELSTTKFNEFKTVLIYAVVVSGLVAQLISGTYLYLGFPQVGIFSYSMIPLVILVGGCSGFMGGIFSKLLILIVDYKARTKSMFKLSLWAMGTGLILAILAIFFSEVSLGSGKEVFTSILFRSDVSTDWKWVLARMLSTMVSYLSGCAGGIFAPSLAIGATIGAQISNIFDLENYKLFTLLGMIGFLTGVTKAPFTSFVLVLEMTDRHSAILPMMLAAVCAYLASKLVMGHSFYEVMKLNWLLTDL